jgi:hypothetical protein
MFSHFINKGVILRNPKNLVSARMLNLAIGVIFYKLEIGSEYTRKKGEYVLKLIILSDTQSN